MAEVLFSESAYRFSDPIRVFKANDPYYYEVDNIPVRQLQENCLWLKDQLTGGPIEIKNIARKEFADLKPSLSEVSARRIVVNTGRYTARVNDAYNVQPLGSLFRFLVNAEGYGQGQAGTDPVLNKWGYTLRNEAVEDSGFGSLGPKELDDILKAWQDEATYDAAVGLRSLGMNGLAERAFAFPTKSVYDSTVGSYTDPDLNPDMGIGQGWTGYSDVPFPIFEAILWANHADTSLHTQSVTLFNEDTDDGTGFLHLPRLENQLIRRWRGVARTAVVDVPNPITIEIPPFRTDEFFYRFNEDDTEIVANTRIDLLFIYTKPVDVAETTIVKPLKGANSKKTIITPELGIVKGAGIGIDSSLLSPSLDSPVPGQAGPIEAYDDNGNLMILPDPRAESERGDGDAGINGFDNITQAEVGEVQHQAYGSFPVPDDLLNLAPALLDSVEATEWDLVGQSILPIAYIVSRKGVTAFEEKDIIDIRPFFRTAELTYNERSGIAAAYPPLSLANPATGRRDLDRVEQRIRTRINELSPELQGLLDDALNKLPITKPRCTFRLDGPNSGLIDRRLLIKDFRPLNNRAGTDFANENYPNADVYSVIDIFDAVGDFQDDIAIQLGIGGIYQINVHISGQPKSINTGDTFRAWWLSLVNDNHIAHGAEFILPEEQGGGDNPWYIYPTQRIAEMKWGGPGNINTYPMYQYVAVDNDDFEIGGSFHLSFTQEFQTLDKISFRVRGSGTPDREIFWQGNVDIVRISNPGGGEGAADSSQ